MRVTIPEVMRAKISLCDITNAKSRQAPIKVDGQDCSVILAKTCTLRTPWNISSFDGGERCNLDIVLESAELDGFCQWLDKAIYDAADPKRFFSKPPKNPEDWYRPLRRKSTKDGYADHMRCKCTQSPDKKSFKVYDKDRRELSLQDVLNIDWRSTKFAAVVRLKSCFFQASSYGPVLELDALLVEGVFVNADVALQIKHCLCHALEEREQAEQREREEQCVPQLPNSLRLCRCCQSLWLRCRCLSSLFIGVPS